MTGLVIAIAVIASAFSKIIFRGLAIGLGFAILAQLV